MGLKPEFLALFLPLARCLCVVRREHVSVEYVGCFRDHGSVTVLPVHPCADSSDEEGHEDVQVLAVGVRVGVECAASVDQEVCRADVVQAVVVNECLVGQVVALVRRVDSYGGHVSSGLLLVVRGNPRMHP